MKLNSLYFSVLALLSIPSFLGAQDFDLEKAHTWDLDSFYTKVFDLSGYISEESQRECNRFLRTTKYLKDSAYIGYAFDSKAMDCFARNYLDSAFAYEDSAISLFRKLNDSIGLSTAYYNKSIFHEYKGEYATTLNLIHLGREIDLALGYESENDMFYYHRLSGVVYAQDQVELALRYAHDAWKAMHEAGMPYSYMVPEMHLNYSWLYNELGVSELAVYHAEKAYSFTKEDSLVITRSGALEILSDEALKAGKEDLAWNYAMQSLKLSKGYGDLYYEIYSYFFLVDHCIRKGDVNKAGEYAAIIKKYEDEFAVSPTYVWSVNEALYQYNKAIGEFSTALKHLENRNKAQEEINKFDGRAAMRQFDEEMAVRSQKLAEAKSEIQNQELKQQRQYIVFAIILLVIASLSLVYIFLSRQKLQRSNKILWERNSLIQEQKEEILQQRHNLSKQNEELNILLNSKDRLFSILAHDLRQPFNQILGIIDLMDNDALNGPERKEILIGLKSSVQSTSDLVNNVLLWSKAQFAGTTVNPVALPLSETVKKSLLYFSMALSKKKIGVNFDIPEELSIRFDKDHFESVMRNIFSNAYKFSPANSTIYISAKQDKENKRVYLRVKDEGVGMDQYQREKLLEGTGGGDTYQGTLQENGTGIGMIIVRDFLKENNSSFDIESQLEQGTSMILNLPSA